MPNDNNSDISCSSGDLSDKYRKSNVSPPPMPKHIPFPEYAITSELTSELIMTLFTTGAAILQFINIYRSNWWLPNSYVNNVVNLHLIEPHMRDLILLITTRRLSYCLILFGIKRYKHKVEEHRLLSKIFKYWFGATQLTIMSYCIYKIYQPFSYTLLLYLIYPAIVYLLIFGFQMEPFMRTAFEIDGSYFNGLPLHCCTTNAVHIREEIETLRNDFNKRFKQIIFTSVVNAYYTSLVPCMLAIHVQYNVLRIAQHIITVWLTAFCLCAVFLFPAKYSDILHRASLHLGYWQQQTDDTNNVETISPTAPYTWLKNAVYGNGSLVKHKGIIYRSYGLSTVAMPGNAAHARFYKFFHCPTTIYSTLAALQATIILAEIVSLTLTVEWHFLLSISFVAFTNQFTFFKIMRDYMITQRLYLAENSISGKYYN